MFLNSFPCGIFRGEFLELLEKLLIRIPVNTFGNIHSNLAQVKNGKNEKWLLLLLLEMLEKFWVSRILETKNKRTEKLIGRCFVEKNFVLENCAKFTEKYLWWSLFINKVAGLQSETVLKKSPTQVFYYEFCKVFKNIFW